MATFTSRHEERIMKDIEARAVDYVAQVLRDAADWQEGQHALADHAEFGPWIERECGGDEMAQVAMCQRIIRAAEEKCSDQLVR